TRASCRLVADLPCERDRHGAAVPDVSAGEGERSPSALESSRAAGHLGATGERDGVGIGSSARPRAVRGQRTRAGLAPNNALASPDDAHAVDEDTAGPPAQRARSYELAAARSVALPDPLVPCTWPCPYPT